MNLTENLIDAQVVDLETVEEQELEDLKLIMQMAEAELAAGRSYEHIHALLRAFLNIHSETIAEVEDLRLKAADLQASMKGSWDRLSGKLQSVRCLLNFLGNLPS